MCLIFSNKYGSFLERLIDVHILQMYQSETGGITEQELTSILKSAMGVSDLNVSNLFKAIDDQEKGEIAYGKSIFYRFLCMEIRKGIWKRNLTK